AANGVWTLTTPFVSDVRTFGIDYALAQLPAESFNAELPPEFAAFALRKLHYTKNWQQSELFSPQANEAGGQDVPPPSTPWSNNQAEYNYRVEQNLAQIAKNGFNFSRALVA